MNDGQDGFGYKTWDGSYLLEGFSFDLGVPGAQCSVVPERLVWPEIGNQPSNRVYVTFRHFW